MRPTRLLTGLVSVALVAAALVALLPDCASAYLCDATLWSGSQQERAERALDRSTAVFAGEVVEVKKDDKIWGGVPSTTVSFRVSEVCGRVRSERP